MLIDIITNILIKVDIKKYYYDVTFINLERITR